MLNTSAPPTLPSPSRGEGKGGGRRWSVLISAAIVIASLAGPAWADPVPTDTTPPAVRHSVPANPTVGETIVIESVVQDEGEVAGVTVWYRAVGTGEFQTSEAVRRGDDQRRYDARITLTGAFGAGLEYYVAASDRSGNRGTDGTEAVPYFVAVRAMPALAGLSTTQGATAPRPWWKRRWVWVTVSAVVLGGAAFAASRNDESGTVVVE